MYMFVPRTKSNYLKKFSLRGIFDYPAIAFLQKKITKKRKMEEKKLRM